MGILIALGAAPQQRTGGTAVSRTSYSIADARGPEGSRLSFVVTRAGNLNKIVVIGLAVSDDSARAGADYSTKVSAVVLASGQASAAGTVNTIATPEVKPERRFRVTIAVPAGAQVVRGEAIGTIESDVPVKQPDETVKLPETAATRPVNVIPSYYRIIGGSAVEGQLLTFRIERRGDLSRASIVNLVLVEGSARATVDYRQIDTTIRFPPGRSTATTPTITIPRAGLQPSRHLTARLVVQPPDRLLNPEGAVGTIVDASSPQPPPTSRTADTKEPDGDPLRTSGTVENGPQPIPTGRPDENQQGGSFDHHEMTPSRSSITTIVGILGAILVALIAVGLAARRLFAPPPPALSCTIPPARGRVGGEIAILPPSVDVIATITVGKPRSVALAISHEEPLDG